MIDGISQLSEVIRQSYGPKGGNISVESENYPGHFICNDAQSIIQSIQIEDPVERRGLNFIKELSDKASKDSGEGRKTTIIIAEEILKGGFKAKVKGMKLKEELDELLPKVIESLDRQSERVELEDIGAVAETSSRDKDTGEWMWKIYQQIGRDGVVHIEGSGTFETYHEVTDGVKFEGAGMVSPYMAENGTAVYEKPVILVTKKKIERDSDISGLVDRCVKLHQPLVIFTDDMDQGVASRLIATHRAGVAKILIIKAPIFYKDFIFEDFSKVVGATIVETGLSLEKLPLEVLGTCDKIIVDKEDTVVMGIKDIREHKEKLRTKGDNDSILRLYRLNTKTAILKMGAGSESELSYKMLKAKDAANACRLALEEGVLPGAATSLVKAAEVLGTFKPGSAEDIFSQALLAPHKQLIENNGGKKLNLKGVWDSALVVKNAVRNAISLSGIILTISGDIRLPELTEADKQIKILSMQQNRVKF